MLFSCCKAIKKRNKNRGREPARHRASNGWTSCPATAAWAPELIQSKQDSCWRGGAGPLSTGLWWGPPPAHMCRHGNRIGCSGWGLELPPKAHHHPPQIPSSCVLPPDMPCFSSLWHAGPAFRDQFDPRDDQKTTATTTTVCSLPPFHGFSLHLHLEVRPRKGVPSIEECPATAAGWSCMSPSSKTKR